MKTRLLFAFLAFPALSVLATESSKDSGPLIDFRVDTQKSVANDLGRASAYIETTSSDAAEVARKVKPVIADGLALAKAQSGISARSGATHTYPIYGKGSRNIESWRMRSEILLESRDAATLSTTLGKLQSTLAIGNIVFTPAPETRRKAEEEATLEAIEAFNAKAARIAAAMKRPYRLKQMSINGNSHFPQPMPVMRAAAMMAEAAPMPTEAGESTVTVTISGQIELLD